MACNTSLVYYIGSTTERFTIANIIHESSVIATNPNEGTNTGGTQLDIPWVTENFGTVNKYTFKGTKSISYDTKSGDAHLLIVVPTALTASNFAEKVLGTSASLTDGIHYASFGITAASINYTCFYLRDLTNTTFPIRQFMFDISLV